MFNYLGNKLRQLFKGKVDETRLEEMEALFYEADLGAATSAQLTESVRKLLKKNPDINYSEIIEHLKKDLSLLLTPPSLVISNQPTSPHVVLIVGVNGNGKTTTLAKLAHRYQKSGKSVLIAAADTFRAAAIEQLTIWAERLGVDIVKGQPGSDPASVAFDAIQAAKNRSIDIVLIDTAGRLHTKTDLMQELEKVRRVCHKACPGAPHETFLILDATVGQNGVEQAQIFHKHTPLTGLILTKLDGSAKGGAALALQKKVSLPIRFIGTGEGLADLKDFDISSFVEQLLAPN